MSPDTKTEVGRIAAAICDGLCHWPHVLGEVELSAKCDGCRPIIDIANLAEKLEGPQRELPGQLHIERWTD